MSDLFKGIGLPEIVGSLWICLLCPPLFHPAWVYV